MTATDTPGVRRASAVQVWIPLLSLWVLWGSTYLGIAIMGRELPPLLGNGLRFLTAAAILAVVLLVARGPREFVITRRQLRSTTTMGVALLGVGIGTVALAERYVPSGVVALTVAVLPLWVIVFRLVARDRPTALTLVGTVVGLTGLVLMLLPGGTEPVAGADHDVVLWSLALMGGTFVWAFFSWRSAGYEFPSNPLVTTAYELLAGGVVLLIVGTSIGERVHVESISAETLWAGGFLVFASLAGYTAYTWLLQNAPLSLVSTYAYVNPVVAVFLGWLVIGESLTRDVVVGLVVVVGGVVLVVTGERRR